MQGELRPETDLIFAAPEMLLHLQDRLFLPTHQPPDLHHRVTLRVGDYLLPKTEDADWLKPSVDILDFGNQTIAISLGLVEAQTPAVESFNRGSHPRGIS